MADTTVRGRVVWHELITPDAAGAHSFYSKVLGWKQQAWEQDPSYSMFAAASGPLGGTVEAPSGTPHWLQYIATPDIEATVQQAQSLGGRVVKAIQSMPTGSKYAELADPQGAVFGVYWSQTHSPEAAPKRGEFSWEELATSDYKAAFQFYSALFGWEISQEHDMGGAFGVYLVFARNGKQIGGMFTKPAQMPGPPAWCSYVRVKDVNAIVKKVKSARGNLINGPMEVPGGDWVAQFIDPYGAMFAVHALAADVKAAQGRAPAAAAANEAVAEPAPQAKPEAPKKAAAPSATPAASKPAAGKSAAAKKKAAPRKAAKKKAPPRKKAAAKKKARPAAKSAKRPARKAAKAAKKGGRKQAAQRRNRAGGKKKSAKKPRKGK